MGYETDKDTDWVRATFNPRGQKEGAPPQDVPYRVLDGINPVFDALGWQRYGTLTFEDAEGVNSNIISFAPVPSGQHRYYPWVHILPSGGAPAGTFWLGLFDGTNMVALSLPQVLIDGQASSTALPRGVLVPTGFNLQARSEVLSGVGVTISLQAFFITLNTAESIQPT